MPFTTFANGAILNDTDLNNYLMKQAVIVCTSGTRPASPVEGMFIYESDTDRYMSYTGSSWAVVMQIGGTSYVPTLTAATTNPTLGSGGSASGRYVLWGGKQCTVRFSIVFGTSGTNAGSGQYLVALPFQAASNITGGVPNVGSGVIRCAGSVSTVTWFCSSGSTTMAALTTAGNNVASAAPGAWGANDYLSATFTYETV